MPQEPPQVADETGKILHQLLLDEDPTATSRIAELYFPLIIQRLERQFSNLPDPQLITIAVTDALLNYFNRPAQYNSGKTSLLSYLCMSASGDLRNLLVKMDKHTANIVSFQEYVEDDGENMEYTIKAQNDSTLDDFVLNSDSPIWLRIEQVIPNPTDQEILLLMMDNVRDTARFAQILGITNLSSEEQAQEVKRQKDRIKKKLQRTIDKSALEGVER